MFLRSNLHDTFLHSVYRQHFVADFGDAVRYMSNGAHRNVSAYAAQLYNLQARQLDHSFGLDLQAHGWSTWANASDTATFVAQLDKVWYFLVACHTIDRLLSGSLQCSSGSHAVVALYTSASCSANVQFLNEVDFVGITEAMPMNLIALQQALGLQGFPAKAEVCAFPLQTCVNCSPTFSRGLDSW